VEQTRAEDNWEHVLFVSSDILEIMEKRKELGKEDLAFKMLG